MRILANENFPRAIVEAMRMEGHDVAWVWEGTRGTSDAVILARAQRESRLIATFDKDFGELAFHARLPSDCGVILFRLDGGLDTQMKLVLLALRGPAEWAGRFTTVTNERIRVRLLPRA